MSWCSNPRVLNGVTWVQLLRSISRQLISTSHWCNAQASAHVAHHPIAAVQRVVEIKKEHAYCYIVYVRECTSARASLYLKVLWVRGFTIWKFAQSGINLIIHYFCVFWKRKFGKHFEIQAISVFASSGMRNIKKINICKMLVGFLRTNLCIRFWSIKKIIWISAS